MRRLDLGIEYSVKDFGMNLKLKYVLKFVYTYMISFVAQLITI